MSIREDVRTLIDGLASGQIERTFDRFYAHNVMISENGAGVLVGKAANENYYSFVNGDLLADATLVQITVRGNRAQLKWALGELYFTTDQLWNGRRVVREDYSYSVNSNAPTSAPPSAGLCPLSSVP